MQIADWTVIVLYGLGMIAVGYYYSRRSATTEEYMLGGRQMRSWMVGFSLFASLMSAISYLMWPGEMIKHGPTMFIGLLSYPLVFWVVGWFLVPRIMKFQVSSAYELLEIRLGVSVRILAAVYFLAMRIIWMAVIIYMSAEKVIVPIMQWPTESVIWVSIVLGMVTVIYTSLGGLRAVVLTDVIQTFILFGGAIVALVLITSKMGFSWWPDHWASNWQHLKFLPTPGQEGADRTVIGAFIAWFGWYVCTAGSDQMAIQRYLATRDVKAARKAVLTSLIADTLVSLLLGILGLALLGYFSAHGNLLPDDWTVQANADQLLPHFIIIGLPAGFTGLIIAGLLAAAMSSLSSGLNSSSLVICRDFIDRFYQKELTPSAKVKLAQGISLGLGVLIVLLSTLVGHIKGNLLEVAYKTVNLLTAPLFVPFFLTYFIRRTTGLGAFAGMIIGFVVAFLVAFWEELTGRKGLGFLWITPLAFFSGVATAYLFSFLPWGQQRNESQPDNTADEIRIGNKDN